MKVYGFRLPDRLIEELDTIAVLEEKDKSELVREMLWEGVTRRGGSNPNSEKSLREDIEALKGRIYQLELRLQSLRGELL